MNTQVKSSHTEKSLYMLPSQNRQQENATYFLKQKLCGVSMIFISLVLFFSIDNPEEISIALLVFISMGIGLIVTRQKVLVIKGWNDGRY